jgi:hypothetical protein
MILDDLPVESNLSRDSHAVVIVAFVMALVSFIVLAAYTPLNLGVRITKEQALKAVEQSPKVDSRIVSDSAPTNAELRWMKLDWRNVDWIKGGHQHLFLVDTPTGDYGPFWLLEYQKIIEDAGQSFVYTGRYIVDADSGQLMAAVEGADLNVIYPHPAPSFGDYSVSSNPELPNIYTPLTLGVGEMRAIYVTVKAGPGYDASLPLTFEAVNVRSDLTVSQNATTAILRTDGFTSVRFSVTRSSAYGSTPSPSSTEGFEIRVSDIFGGGMGMTAFVAP